nr:hypothetical protein [Tanacetum cinerariifolium]
MDSLSTPVVSAAKLPILNPNEFDLWKMRIEQYFLMTYYSLWEVIINGDSPIPTIVGSRRGINCKNSAETKSKNKGKGIMVEEPKPIKKKQQDVAIDHVKQKAKEDPYVQRYQMMKKRPQTEAQTRRNMIMYLKNTAGFRLDYFKGMLILLVERRYPLSRFTLDQMLNAVRLQVEEQSEMYLELIRKLHEELNQDIDWNVAIDHVKQKAKEDLYVKRYQVMKKRPRTEAQAQRNMIMYLKNTAGFRLGYFKGMSYDDIRLIFEAKEDLESLGGIVKERFSTSKPNNYSDDYLLTTLRAMFGRPDGQDQVWKSQRSVHDQAKVKSWKLLESYGVHIISFTTTRLILLVERRYPLSSAAKHKLMLLDTAAERRLLLLSQVKTVNEKCCY